MEENLENNTRCLSAQNECVKYDYISQSETSTSLPVQSLGIRHFNFSLGQIHIFLGEKFVQFCHYKVVACK